MADSTPTWIYAHRTADGYDDHRSSGWNSGPRRQRHERGQQQGRGQRDGALLLCRARPTTFSPPKTRLTSEVDPRNWTGG